MAPKIKFIGAGGNEGRSPAQGTTLMSIGDRGDRALENAARNGLGVVLVEDHHLINVAASKVV